MGISAYYEQVKRDFGPEEVEQAVEDAKRSPVLYRLCFNCVQQIRALR